MSCRANSVNPGFVVTKLKGLETWFTASKVCTRLANRQMQHQRGPLKFTEYVTKLLVQPRDNHKVEGPDGGHAIVKMAQADLLNSREEARAAQESVAKATRIFNQTVEQLAREHKAETDHTKPVITSLKAEQNNARMGSLTKLPEW